MVRATWDELIADERPEHVVLLEAFRTHLRRIPDVEERVHRTEVAYARDRVFASAFVKSGWLEVAIDLLRTVEHPQLRMAFATTKKVTTHRFTLGSPDQLASLDELFREAADTVGPGTRDVQV
jgi:hypothetical protein